MSSFSKHRDIWLFLTLALLVLAISIRFPAFASPKNLALVFNDSAILIILALGQLTVILTRSIDLSVAANVTFTGMSVAMLNAAHPDVSIGVVIVAALLIGLALGAINGLLIWKLGIPSIVVTLGTLTIYRGMAFVLSGGAWVNADQMSPAFIDLQRTQVLALPILSWIAITAVVLFYILLKWTPAGRSFFAVGINPTASTYAGLNVGQTKCLAFCISGMVSGLSGYLWVSRYVIASVEVANGYELSVIAACVIGGASIAGGIGSVAGTVLGALFLGVIVNALPVINVSPFWQMAISGLAIIFAVFLNARSERRKGRLILRKS